MKRRFVNSFLPGIAALFVVALTGGCASAPVSLTAVGATFPYPLYARWFDAYRAQNDVAINYQPMGSGAGVQQIRSRTVDFAASDVPISDKQLKSLRAPLVQIPTVAGAIVIAYNLPGLGAPLRLDGKTLSDIYRGKITHWNDSQIAALNGDAPLPDLPITVAHRSDGSGTTAIFTSYLAAVSPEWEAQVGSGKSVSWPVGIGGKGNSGVAGVIKQSPGALGYMELAYARQNDFACAALRNKAGFFVQPSTAATTAAVEGASAQLRQDIRAPIINAAGAKAYPIAALTYFLIYKTIEDDTKRRDIKAFLEWSMNDGQKMAEQLFYAPLPASVREINRQLIGEISGR